MIIELPMSLIIYNNFIHNFLLLIINRDDPYIIFVSVKL